MNPSILHSKQISQVLGITSATGAKLAFRPSDALVPYGIGTNSIRPSMSLRSEPNEVDHLRRNKGESPAISEERPLSATHEDKQRKISVASVASVMTLRDSSFFSTII